MALDEKTRAVVEPLYQLSTDLRNFRQKHLFHSTERRLFDLVQELVFTKAEQISMEGVR